MESMEENQHFVEAIVDISDDESLVAVPIDEDRRTSKGSFSSMSPMMSEDSASPYINVGLALPPALGNPSSPGRSEFFSPRVNELRLSVDNLGPSSRLSGRESSESAMRGSPKVNSSGVRNSPSSPRKMLVSTPVSGNFDFQGMISPHHVRRLSSRSASSPRLVLSAQSPKVSPKENAAKASPRDLFGLPSSSQSSTPTRIPPRLPLSQSNTFTTSAVPSSRRTASGTVIPPPMSGIAGQTRVMMIDKQRTLFPPTSSKRSDERVNLNRSNDAVLEKTNDTAEIEMKPVELIGYPLKPSLESRRAAFERLQMEVFNRNRTVSRDWESDGTIGGDSSTNASVVADVMRKKVARRMGRRMSDPYLEYTYPWPVSVGKSRKDADESIENVSSLLQVKDGSQGTHTSNEADQARSSPARLADVAGSLFLDSQSALVKPMAVRLPSPLRATSATEDSQNTSSSPTPATSPEQTTTIPPMDLKLEIPELYMSASTPHRALSMPIERNRALESPALTKSASLPNPPMKKAEMTSKTASLFSNLAHFAKSPGARSLSSRRRNRSQSVHSPSPAPSNSPTRTLARRLAGFSGSTPVADTKAMSAPLPPSPKNLSGPKVLSPRRSQEQIGIASPFQFTRQPGQGGNASFAGAGTITTGLPPPGLPHHHHQGPNATLSRQGPSGSISSSTPSSQTNPFAFDSAVPPPSSLSLMRTVSSDELHQRAPMLSVATRSSSLQHHATSHGVEEVPHRKSVSTSFAAATNSLTSSLFPPALKEKSPSSSPTARTSKRRASFNFVGFDATLAALKQKFKRKNSASARDSTSTPSSPIVDDRRTMPSTSVNSTLTEDSDDDGFTTRRTDRARFYRDERHNSIDSEDDSGSEGDEFRQDGFSFAGDNRENEDKEDADAFFAGVPKEATVEEILRAVGKVQSRKRRQELFESLFFCAPDFGDPSGEQMTGKVADFAEDSGQIDVLEMWLIKFRAVDKLRFYDPYVSARVREVLDEFVDGKARRPSSSDNEPFASFRSVRKDGKKPSFDGSENIQSDDDEVEEEDANDLASLIYVEPREDADVDDAVSASSSSSSSGYSSSDVGRIREEVDAVRIAQRLLRRLNRSQNDFVYSNNIPNEWEHDFDEERGARGVGLGKRRKSESDITLALSHVRLSEQFGVNNVRGEEIGVDELNHKPLNRLRRATSLPFLLLWHETSIQQPVRTRREYSASSFGSFRSLSHFATSPRKMSFTSRMMRDAEDEEHCVLEMLAFIVAPPLSTMQSSGSISQSSTITATTTGSPPPPSISKLGSNLHATANLERAAFRSETPSLILPSYHGSSLVRTYSVDTPTSPHVLGSSSETWSVLGGGGGGDAGSVDGYFEGPLSPVSDHAMRRRDDSVSMIKGGRGRHGRQHSASQHHYKQPSGSSLHTFLSGTTFGPRRSAVSSSFSSFIEAEMMSLPERGLRGDIKKYEPRIVAEQLTATMCRTAYFQIGPNALRTSEARKRDEHVQKLVRYFEVLSNWPVTEILTDVKRTASDRIDDFGWFISLAKACREMGNYHAVFALVGGLQSPLLIWVADIAHRKDKKQFHSLKRLVRTDGNYRIYHADLTKRNSRLPCIPYLGLLNRTLLTLQNDAPVFIDENMRIVNFNRCRLIRKTIADYLKWQNPSPHSLASNGIVLDPCVRKALAESMSRSILDYRELSTMSSLAKSGYVKSVRQRAFHKARKLGHQIVHNVENH